MWSRVASFSLLKRCTPALLHTNILLVTPFGAFSPFKVIVEPPIEAGAIGGKDIPEAP